MYSYIKDNNKKTGKLTVQNIILQKEKLSMNIATII